MVRAKYLGACAITALMIASGPASAQTLNDTIAFQIAPQPLEEALILFSDQSGVQVVASGALLAGKQSPGFSRSAVVRDALNELLNDTGLAYQPQGVSTVSIMQQVAFREERKERPFRVAQIDSQNDSVARLNIVSDDDEGVGDRDEIVVTGSLIRGTRASVGANLTTIDAGDIVRGGFGALPEVFQSLTNNFTGGINEFTSSAENDANLNGGTSINLRGLGAGNTLTLVNGRRIAQGGAFGNFVDISNIPASLIDRIEVLADGASATYGSDAIGGVVNVIMRKDFEGAETGFRIGTVTEGKSQEYRVNQLIGVNWPSGNAVLSYEYFNRERLRAESKPFSRDQDLTSLGGDNFRSNASVPANVLDPATFFQTVAFAIPDGQDGVNLSPDDLLPGEVNFFNQNQGRDLLQDQEQHSLYASAAQELGGRLELFAEARYSDRDFQVRKSGTMLTVTVPSTNPFFVDPFGGSSSVRIRYNTFRDFGVLMRSGDARTFNGVLGGKASLWGDWQVQAYGAYSSERRRATNPIINTAPLNAALADTDPTTAFNPFGDGSFQQNSDTIDSILFEERSNGESAIWSGNLVADGSLFRLPGGDVRIAGGVNFDSVSLSSFVDRGASGVTESAQARDVFAVFGEAYIPLFGEANRRTGLESLVFTASARFEDFDDVGSTTNPKFGLLWSPFEGLNIRSTYGSSFRAPDLVQLDVTNNARFIFSLPDPSSPTGNTLSLFLTGNNADLKSETADSWTIGFDFTPTFSPEFSFDLSYYHVKFENRITSASAAGLGIFSQEERFAAAITRNPTQADIDAACDVEDTFFDFNGPCRTSPVGAIVDSRLINAAITETDGLDFNVRYGVETAGWGSFDFHVGGTYILNFDEAFGPTAPVENLINTVRNPIGLQMRNGLSWSNQKGLSANAFVNFTGSSTDNISSPERKIDSWTTVDLTLAYTVGARLRSVGLNNTAFSLSVRNLFDNDPPFVNNSDGVAFDSENFSPLGRFVSLYAAKKF